MSDIELQNPDVLSAPDYGAGDTSFDGVSTTQGTRYGDQKSIASDFKSWLPYSAAANSAGAGIAVIAAYAWQLPVEVGVAIGSISAFLINGALVVAVILLKLLQRRFGV